MKVFQPKRLTNIFVTNVQNSLGAPLCRLILLFFLYWLVFTRCFLFCGVLRAWWISREGFWDTISFIDVATLMSFWFLRWLPFGVDRWLPYGVVRWLPYGVVRWLPFEVHRALISLFPDDPSYTSFSLVSSCLVVSVLSKFFNIIIFQYHCHIRPSSLCLNLT